MTQLSLFGVVRGAQKSAPTDRPPAGYHPAPHTKKAGWTDGRGNYWYPGHSSGNSHQDAQDAETARAIELTGAQLALDEQDPKNSDLRRSASAKERARRETAAREAREAAEAKPVHEPAPTTYSEALSGATVQGDALVVPLSGRGKAEALELARWLVSAEGRDALAQRASALGIALDIKHFKLVGDTIRIGTRQLTEAEMQQRRDAAQKPSLARVAAPAVSAAREAVLAARGEGGRSVASQTELDARDWGDKIGGARKDLWDQIHMRNLEALEAEGEDKAFKLVTKERVLGAHDPDYDRGLGSTPGASLIKREILKRIAPRPENTPGHRANYVAGADWLRKTMDTLHTPQEMDAFLRVWRGVLHEQTMPVGRVTTEELVARYGSQPLSAPPPADEWRSIPGGTYRNRWSTVVTVEGEQRRVYLPPGVVPSTQERPRTAQEDVEYRASLNDLKGGTDIRRRLSTAATTHVVLKQHTPEVDRLTRIAKSFGDSFYKQVKGVTKGSTKASLWIAVEGAQSGVTWESLSPQERGSRENKGNAPRSYTAWKVDVGDAQRVGGPTVPDQVTEETFARDFKVQQGEYGRSVAANGLADAHLNHCYAAFTDLADILGLERPQISNGGQLKMAFGARGKGGARAHYESGKKVINITQLAAGSLAHEWGHYLDDLLGDEGYTQDGDRVRTKFGSHGADELSPHLPPEVGAAMLRVRAAMLFDDPTKAVAAERLERAKDAAIARMGLTRQAGAYGMSAYRQAQNDRDAAHEALKALGELTPTTFHTHAKTLGGYWARHHEMFARAFESFIEDELTARQRRSDYLVNGTQTARNLWRKPDDEKGEVSRGIEPYPQGAERKRIGDALRALMSAVARSGQLAKSLTEQVKGGLFVAMLADSLGM